ncbi:uncharacterized protein LOC135345445 isoform X2 [Halichondria panicea]|uniref:uncharacterized protein LOC135345445 isoform X2 n=1 Tax=Halichondria panicea TaxID=6063 RepID=UPI00312B6ABE
MVCFIIALIFLLRSSNAGEIVSFNQSAVAVPLYENMTFDCEANGDEAYLKIDDKISFLIEDHHGIYLQDPIRRNDRLWILSVTIQTNSTNNNTKITCFVDSTEKYRYLIISGPPSNPRLVYNYHNRSLTLNWNEPFTHPGFNVIGYTLELFNTADHETITAPIDLQLDRVYSQNVSILPNMCTAVEYTVTAYNELGNSTASVTGGFPIDIAPVEIQSRVLYQGNGSLHLEIWFEPAYSCSFQVVNYTVYLEESIEETVLLNYCDNRYSVHSGLSSGANYTVVVEAKSIAGLTVTKKKVAILEQKLEGLTTSNSPCSCTAEYGQEMLTYQIISGALAAFFAILAVLMIIVLSLYCRQRRLQKKKKIKNTLRGTVATPTIPQRPLSLQTKCAATNPIYEGPPLRKPWR